MSSRRATAVASPNIAFIKYWGNYDSHLRLPANGSISMTLGGLKTHTTVTFNNTLSDDALTINGIKMTGAALRRVSIHLDHIRKLASIQTNAQVKSQSNFPSSAGIASSSSAFASLTLAACTAAGLELNTRHLSRLARLGSGSACRSIYGGFVEWYSSDTDEDSFAVQIAPPNHWDLTDLIAIVSRDSKAVDSTTGHSLADTSPVQSARVADASRRLNICRQALLNRQFNQFADIIEQDSNLMHAVMLTSTPPLIYWAPQTIAIMQSITSWRRLGVKVFYTIDAGPNVHCICPSNIVDDISERLQAIPGVLELLQAFPGEGTHIIQDPTP
jgi:diphosphomevalonate decarboxylase